MAIRPKIPKNTETAILTQSKRRCALCFGLNNDFDTKDGQIAHLDGDSSNNGIDNLAFLCLLHHDKYDGATSQSKGYTEHEIKHHRDKLYSINSCSLVEDKKETSGEYIINSQGDEEVNLIFTYEFYQIRYEKPDNPFMRRSSPSWKGNRTRFVQERRVDHISTNYNTLFIQISPLMIVEAAEVQIHQQIKDYILEQEKMRDIRSSNRQYEIEIMEIRDFQNIIVKFFDFGWIEISERQRHVNDFQKYWKLTVPLGHTIRKKLTS